MIKVNSLYDLKKNTLLLGIICMILATFINVASDSLYKWLRISFATPSFYILIARYAGLLLLVVIWQLTKYKSLKPALKTNKPFLQLLRGAIIAASTFSSVFALQHTPIAVYSVLIQFSPIWIILVLQFLPEERLNAKQWICVFIGFIGVVVALNPKAEGFHLAWLLTLIVIFFWGSFQAITRYLSKTETTASLMLYNVPIGMTIGIIGSFFVAKPIPLAEFYGLLLCAALGAMAFSLLILAYRFASAKYVAPLAWLQVVWGMLIDIFVFRASFHNSLLWGAVLIILSAYGIIRLRSVK